MRSSDPICLRRGGREAWKNQLSTAIHSALGSVPPGGRRGKIVVRQGLAQSFRYAFVAWPGTACCRPRYGGVTGLRCRRLFWVCLTACGSRSTGMFRLNSPRRLNAPSAKFTPGERATSRRANTWRLKIGTDGRAGKLMDRVQQLVASLCCSFLVSDGYCMSQGGMQTRCERKVCGLTVVKKPEPPGERIHQAHCAGGELIAGRHETEFIKRPVNAHELFRIPGFCALLEGRGKLAKLGSFFSGCPARCISTHEPLQLSPDLQKSQLRFHVYVRDRDAAARHDTDQPLSRQPLQGLPDGGSPDTQQFRQFSFGHEPSWCQLEGHNHLFKLAVGLLRETQIISASGRPVGASAGCWPDFFACCQNTSCRYD